MSFKSAIIQYRQAVQYAFSRKKNTEAIPCLFLKA